MQPHKKPDNTEEIILDGLQGINRYLAMINSRLEMLLLSDLPEYVKPDLVNMVQAEQEASQILRSLRLICHQHFTFSR